MADIPAIRSFKIDNGFDLSITLDIDTAVLTPDYAHDVSHFWASKDEVLEASEGDDYQAVARYAASRLWGYLMDGYNQEGAIKQLRKQEGWGWPGERFGITIRDHEVPSFDEEYYEVEEVE